MTPQTLLLTILFRKVPMSVAVHVSLQILSCTTATSVDFYAYANAAFKLTAEVTVSSKKLQASVPRWTITISKHSPNGCDNNFGHDSALHVIFNGFHVPVHIAYMTAGATHLPVCQYAQS